MKRPFIQAVSTLLQRWDKRFGSRNFHVGTEHTFKARTYNAGVSAGKITRTRRAEELYKLLSIKPTDEVLIVGPRDVHELYMAWCYGASWQRITGLDLSSRNPKIRVGDMTATAYPDDLFDVIVAAYTISYLADVRAGLAEMYRILRKGGTFAFTHTYDKDSEWIGNHHDPHQIGIWLHNIGFLRGDYRVGVRHKTSAQGRRVEIMTCVVGKS